MWQHVRTEAKTLQNVWKGGPSVKTLCVRPRLEAGEEPAEAAGLYAYINDVYYCMHDTYIYIYTYIERER